MEIDKENLENALSRVGEKVEKKPEDTPLSKDEGTTGSSLSKDEEIGFHKGCLNTLAAERNELFKMLQNVEAIMQAHIKRLQELGVKIEIGEGKN